MPRKLSGCEKEVRVCRHLAERGLRQEWKPGSIWATEALLKQCEADGLVTVRWADPTSLYPWSFVQLTVEGAAAVLLQLRAEEFAMQEVH